MADPTLLTPGVADGRNLEPLWNKGNVAIRSVDDTTIVMFEGPTFGNAQFYNDNDAWLKLVSSFNVLTSILTLLNPGGVVDSKQTS
jgi:hypothetical protein